MMCLVIIEDHSYLPCMRTGSSERSVMFCRGTRLERRATEHRDRSRQRGSPVLDAANNDNVKMVGWVWFKSNWIHYRSFRKRHFHRSDDPTISGRRMVTFNGRHVITCTYTHNTREYKAQQTIWHTQINFSMRKKKIYIAVLIQRTVVAVDVAPLT